MCIRDSAWVALVPTAWLLICTLTAGWQKAFSPDAKVGFLAIANKFQAMIDSGNIPAQYLSLIHICQKKIAMNMNW